MRYLATRSSGALGTIVCAALFAALPLQAQETDAQSADVAEVPGDDPAINSDSILVTGRTEQPSRSEVHSQARDIAVSGNVYDVPLARFEDPICPGIAGLTVETATMMVDRIRENARFVDLAIQEDGCRPNFIVAFVDDGQRTLANLMDQNPARFQWLTSVDKREMLEPGPVRVWTDVQPTTRDGIPIARGRNLVNPPMTRAAMSHSRIYTTLRNDIVSVMIIVDRDAARGMSLLQLADYATMRGLVQTQPTEGMSVGSILGLFEPNGPFAEHLTDFDRAYLNAVYDWIPNLPAAAKLGRVAAELQDIEEAD